MKRFWRELESFFDKMIVPALFVLIVIVVADIFFTEVKYEYEQYFFYADLLVILIFVGDLSFKFKRASSWEGFLKREWLEILAVAPFFWIFRLVESAVRVGELVQEIVHLVTRGGRLARLFAVFGFFGSRHERFNSFVKKLTKSDRFEEASKFFKHPEED